MANYELASIPQANRKPSLDDETNETQWEPEVTIVKGNTPIGNYYDPSSQQQPVDRFYLIFMIFLIHGIGTLMPWNSFINADNYFRKYKLAIKPEDDNETKGQLEDIQKNFLYYIGLSAQLPNILFNALNIVVNLGSGNLRTRVNISLSIEITIFVLTIILASIDSSGWRVQFFYTTIVTQIILHMANGVYQNCIFGTAAMFPGVYTNAILIGTNTSGTFTSLVNILTMWLSPEPRGAAIYYFVTALDVMVICLISYNLLPISSFYRHYSKIVREVVVHTNDSPRKLISESTPMNDSDVPENLREIVDAMVPRQEQVDTSFKGELKNKWLVFKKCWPQLLNVYLTFLITLALFPNVLANIEHRASMDGYFDPIFCFLLFNFCAMVGNMITGYTNWPGKRHTWILVVGRFIFIPFFLFCDFNKKNRSWPVLITNDSAYIIGNFLLAISSGYLSSLCMMFTSSDLKSDDAARAGMLGGFFLVFGIFSGINVSGFLTKLVEL